MYIVHTLLTVCMYVYIYYLYKSYVYIFVLRRLGEHSEFSWAFVDNCDKSIELCKIKK